MGRPKKNTPAPDGWKEVADASAANDTKGKRTKPVQTSLLSGAQPIVAYETHDVEKAISADEAALLNARAADETAKALAVEAQIAEIKEKQLAPKVAQAKEHRKIADQAAKEAAEHKRTIPQRVKVEYHPSRGTVCFYDPESGQKVMLDRAMTPKEMEHYANGDGDDLPPPDDSDEDVIDEEV